MFIGEYSCSVDDKGRLNFPAKFRDEMGAKFYVTRWLDECLIAFPEREWQHVAESLAEKSMVKSRDIQRFLYAKAVEATPDKQGRIILPVNLREQADLGSDVTIIGVGSHAEIWNTEAWRIKDAELCASPLAEDMATLDF